MDPELERLIANARAHGATDEELRAFLASKGYAPPSKPGVFPSPGAAARMALEGLTMNTATKPIAALRALSPNVTYDEALADERAGLAATRRDYPKSSVALEIAGGLPLAFVPGLGAAKVATGVARAAPSALWQATKAAGIGALAGGAGSFVNADVDQESSLLGGLAERTKAAALPAAVGGLFGGTLSALAPSAKTAADVTESARVAGLLGTPATQGLPVIPTSLGELMGSPSLQQLEHASAVAPGAATPAAGFASRRAEGVANRLEALARKAFPGEPRTVEELGTIAAKGQKIPESADELAGLARMGATETPSYAKQIEKEVFARRQPFIDRVKVAVEQAHPGGVPIPAARNAIAPLEKELALLAGRPEDAKKVMNVLNRIDEMRTPQPGMSRGSMSFDQLLGLRSALGELSGYSSKAGQGALSEGEKAARTLRDAVNDAVQSAVDRGAATSGRSVRADFNAAERMVTEFNAASTKAGRDFLRKLSNAEPERAYAMITGAGKDRLKEVTAVKVALGPRFAEFAARELLEMGRTPTGLNTELVRKTLAGMSPEMRRVKFGMFGSDIEGLLKFLSKSNSEEAMQGLWATRSALARGAGGAASVALAPILRNQSLVRNVARGAEQVNRLSPTARRGLLMGTLTGAREYARPTPMEE